MTDAARDRILALADKRVRLREGLRERPEGLGWCRRHSDLADAGVRILFDDLGPGRERIAVLATGGYGRRELAPCSDLDLSIVPADDADPETDLLVRTLFQDLHNAFATLLKMEVGYAYRLVGDAPGLDPKSRTGLLDARLIAGDPVLADRLALALDESDNPGEFILNKIRERERAWQRTNDTPLAMEPHLKEGAGGLRSYHAANWIRCSMGESPLRPSADVETVAMVRNMLHVSAGRLQDHLTFGRREEVAAALGLEPSELAGRLAGAMVALQTGYERQIERIRQARFDLAPGVVAMEGEARITGDADAATAAVGVGTAVRLGLAVSDLPVRVAPPRSGAPALFAFVGGEPVLRALDRSGLLAALLPELTACRTVFPAEPTHAYSVFEHTLRVVRHLDAPPEGFLTELRDSVRDLEPLYLAALLHDVGKIRPEEDHSALGAEMVRAVGERLRLADDVIEHAAWLVREHLSMARFLRLKDVQAPDTVAEFVALVGTEDRLVSLANLTWADIAAVNPYAWTAAQASFHRELFGRTRAALQDGVPAVDPERTRKRLGRQLRDGGDEADTQSFLAGLPGHYLASTDAETVRRHRAWSRRAAEAPVVDVRADPEMGASEVTVVALDAPALLARLLGVFYALDLSLLSIRAATTAADPPVALDTFLLSFAGRPVPAATTARLQEAVADVIAGRVGVDELLRARGKEPDRPQEIFQATVRDGSPVVAEIRAPRGRGMPYRIARRLADEGLGVVSARVGQWAGNGAATFYLVGPGGAPTDAAEVRRALGV